MSSLSPSSSSPSPSSYLIYAIALVPLFFIFRHHRRSRSRSRSRPPSLTVRTAVTQTPDENDNDKSPKTIMQPPRDDLDPPKDDPFTLAELAAFDGRDPARPVYVSIKGDVFDVSRKRETYGQGGSYHIFAGKDGSRGLGKSSLNPEDAVADYSTLAEDERKVLDDWHAFFGKRYNIVGRVTDMPEAVRESSVGRVADTPEAVRE